MEGVFPPRWHLGQSWLLRIEWPTEAHRDDEGNYRFLVVALSSDRATVRVRRLHEPRDADDGIVFAVTFSIAPFGFLSYNSSRTKEERFTAESIAFAKQAPVACRHRYGLEYPHSLHQCPLNIVAEPTDRLLPIEGYGGRQTVQPKTGGLRFFSFSDVDAWPNSFEWRVGEPWYSREMPYLANLRTYDGFRSELARNPDGSVFEPIVDDRDTPFIEYPAK